MKRNNEQNTLVCLLSPPSRATTMTVPIGLLYLQSWLAKNNITSKIVDLKFGKPNISPTVAQKSVVKERILQKLSKLRPKYVGITCFTTDFWDTIELAKKIKNDIGATIIVGGVHANIKPDDFFFEDSPVEVVVSGDGQQPLCDIINRLERKQNLYGIQGVTCRDDTGTVISHGAASFNDWNKMPNPDYSQLDMAYYTQPHQGIIRTLFASGVHIFTTIGCPFQCTFCGNRSKAVKFRPIHNVLDEIEGLKKDYAIDSFYIQDDTFCLDKNRVVEFIEGLKKRKIDLFWGIETRVNLVNEDMIRLLKSSGCIQIDFGVESGSDDALRRMKKGVTVDQTIKAFDHCKTYKMRTFANIMFNTPEETLHDVDMTRELLKRISPTRVGLGLTVPFPGTEIYAQYLKPALTREEYKIFTHPDLFLNVVDPRFHLAKHNLDLAKLRIKTQAQFSGFRVFLDMTLNPYYWRRLYQSKRKKQYLKAIIKNLIFERTKKLIDIFRNWTR